MADDGLLSLLTTAGGVGTGGVASAVAVRFLFNGLKEQLTELTKTLRDSIEKNDKRHESNIGELAALKASADAAHRRIDALEDRLAVPENKRRRRD